MTHRDRRDLRAAARLVMVEAGFAPDFPPDVLREVERLPEAIPSTPDARDLRHLVWSSIDNRRTRDVDQIEAAEQLPEDALRLYIAIADVDVLVPKGSHTDEHASVNTTSVYTGIAVFPMLPARLSGGLTSFVAGQDRLALVVALDVAADGAVVAVDVFRALVRNHARLTYDAVDRWLASGGLERQFASTRGLEDQLRLQAEGARRLAAARRGDGAVSAEDVEAMPVTTGDEVVDLAPPTGDRARELIESLMVATNAGVARWLEEQRVPALRRVVRAPARWDRLVDLAADMGEQLPAEPNGAALGAFLASRRTADPEQYPDLALTVVKLLGPGEYVLERRFDGRAASSHFGVDAAEYTHSTAPNRRYVDLVVQRLAKFAIDGDAPPYRDDELLAVARHCTAQEDAARRVERTMRKRAAAIFMADRIGESFPALVTGASPKGTYVRLLRPAVEGRVVRGGRDVDVGDTVRVRLVAVDAGRGYIDFENTAGDETRRKLERSRRKKRAAVRLAPRIGDSFDAVVTKAGPSGTYVRLTSEDVEGRVVRGHHGLATGDRIRVTLLRTDPVHGFIDFEHPAGIAPRKNERMRRKQAWAASLQHRRGDRFDAVVTGVTPHATWLRTLEPEVEGRLVRGFHGVRVGERLDVVLLDADPVRGWIDFARRPG